MNNRPLLTVAVGLGVIVMGVVFAVSRTTEVTAEDFTRDVTASAGVEWYVGSVGVLNLVLWGIAAALAAFVAYLQRAHRRALILFAVLSVLLLLDDSLLQHELVGPEIIGIPEVVFLVGYAVMAVCLLPILSPRRVGTAGYSLLAAGALLAGSIAVDQVIGSSYLVEDGLKLLGTLLWATVPVLVHLHDQPRRPVVIDLREPSQEAVVAR